ncbi:MAG: hypothetical protein RR087_09280, partial [Oscillospiraceae bacterium]
MAYLICMALVLPIFSASSVAFKKDIFKTAPFVMLFIILAGSIFGIMGAAILAVYLLYALCALSFLYLLFALFTKMSIDYKRILQGVALMALFMAVAWYMCRGHLFSDWDEYSHWGLSVKLMYEKNDLYTFVGTPDSYASYPPALSVLGYIFTKGAGLGFREDIIIFASAILWGTMLLYAFKSINVRKNIFSAIFSFVLLMLVPVTFLTKQYFRMGIDAHLGITLGFILLTAFLPNKDSFDNVLALMAIALLSLLKSAGFGLALMACAVLLIENVYNNRCKSYKPIRKITMYALPFACAIIPQLVWKLHLAARHVPMRWQETSETSLFDLVLGKGQEYQYNTIKNFLQKIFTVPFYGTTFHFPFIVWFVIFFALFALVYKLCPVKEQRLAKAGFVSVVSITVIYTISLLYSYLFVFAPFEAEILASFNRYVASCFTATAMVLLSFLAVYACGGKKQNVIILAAVLVIVPILSPEANETIKYSTFAAKDAAATQQVRQGSMIAKEKIYALNEEKPRVYVVTDNDFGAERMRIDYEILPIVLPVHQSIIAQRCTATESAWTTIYTQNEWQSILYKDFDYVYVHSVSSDFERDYIQLFENPDDLQNNAMYFIIKSSDGTVKLRLK